MQGEQSDISVAEEQERHAVLEAMDTQSTDVVSEAERAAILNAMQ